jgi:subtilase family serine protease
MHAQSVATPNRITHAIDDTKLVRLQGNVHPMARSEFDQGLVSSDLSMYRIVMVLQRSPQQEAALTAFMAEQYDSKSPNFHHWLTPEEFGKQYGPSDSDIQLVTSWLQNNGFRLDNVSKGRVTIEFSGTAHQVQEVFHTEIHRYLVNGKEHIANSSDPEIPEAIAPVVQGISSLHNFFPKPQMVKGKLVTRNAKTGKITPVEKTTVQGGNRGQFTYTDDNGFTREDITPYDFATIYNVLPLWNAGINGKGETIAISGASDISLTDVANFQKSFGLPNNPPTVIHNGTDPGEDSSGRGENTLDVEWSGAVAPQAKVAFVVSASTSTTFGGQLSNSYIVDHVTAPVMSASYGECELGLGTSGNAAYNKIWQQGAAEGISIFESAGDQGSAGCESQDTAAPNAASTGLQVNGMASSPYVTAVGGTDFLWQNNSISTYWNTSNSANGATAKGYIPEIPWNSTCTSSYIISLSTDTTAEQFCNDAYDGQYDAYYAFVVIAAGSGGKSACTTPSGTTAATCSGGYAKPSWQTGTGVPSDGKRDLPDVSLFASGGYPDGFVGSAYLVCDSENAPCDYSSNSDIIYQEIGGTSASSPAMAGMMALVVQKMGGAQGLANPAFYALAAKENLTTCNSNTVKNGSTCVFYDTTSGNNSQVCVTGSTNCKTSTSGDELGVLTGYTTTKGYDLATGLGSINATNLVNGWSSAVGTRTVTLSPTSIAFPNTSTGTTSASKTITLKNTGSSATTISSITVTGANTTSFHETNNCGTSVAAGASCSIIVTFEPVSATGKAANISVADNATGSPQVVTLTGTGVSTPTVTVSPTSIAFPNTGVGVTSASKTITLKNTSTIATTISSITITGANTTSFHETNNCGTSLAAGASCSIAVTFKPVSATGKGANISIADNATGSPQVVTLTGTGVSTPTVTLSPTSIAFPNTSVGITSASKTITVKNTSTLTTTISSITITGANTTSFHETNNCGTSLAAGASCSIAVTFKPVSATGKGANISVADNATGSPQLVTLTGTGQ